MTQTVTLFHASNQVLKPNRITIPGPRASCDFGPGFYLTDTRHIAEEWVCHDANPVINTYQYHFSPSQLLYLTDTDWLRVIIGFRLKKYNVTFKSPVIHGLIANDRLFDSLRDFIRGVIGDLRLVQCLDFCKLGTQYCLRDNIHGLSFVDSYTLTNIQKETAQQRLLSRRKNMLTDLRKIYRTPLPNEQFIEDYFEKGDYNEA